MPGRVDHASQKAAIAKVTEIGPHSTEIRSHLALLLDSSAFKGSRRSQRFLNYIVENALAGHFEQLKERTIGSELFGRQPSYDTGEDSIVRVTASDCRRRLFEYYAEHAAADPIRIELPAGSYIPEIHVQAADASLAESPGAPNAEVAPVAARSPHRALIAYLVAAGALATALWLWIENGSLRNAISSQGPPAARVLPWSALFEPGRRVSVILSDTNFGAIQDVLGNSISLPDYANHQYLPAGRTLRPETASVVQLLMRTQFTSTADAAIAVRLSDLARRYSQTVNVRPARNLQVRDLKADENFILMGSSRVNPWVSLYEKQLDFRIEFDPAERRQVVRNRAPQAGEKDRYVPTAVTGGTGDAYGMVAFVDNPGQSGHSLLVAGTSMEGTEAAAEFLTNSDRLAMALRRIGINPGGAPQPFEVLIKLKSMAGAPNSFDVIAVHTLKTAAN